MCGAFGFTAVNIFKERFNISNNPKVSPLYNIRPSMNALIVTKNSPNKGENSRFGISAPWNPSQLIINAMSETVMDKKTFKTLFRESRCLIPANFFFEWQKSTDGIKQPFCIKLATDQCFSFAGLYNETGFVILTTRPNTLMRRIHNRQPLILHFEDEEDWLNIDTEEDRLLEIMQPFPDGTMEAYKVNSLVNKPSNQGEELIVPLT